MPHNINEDQPTHWFEPLYANANKEGQGVPWANMKVHPAFGHWLSRHRLDGQGKKALVIGCGMGDDAVELEALGFEVTAFDISESAINYCKERFPASKSTFIQADLFEAPATWNKHFDFVLEIYTIQALPPKYETELIKNIADFVAPKGELLVVAEVSREERDFQKGPPWVLTTGHIDTFVSHGLKVAHNYIEASTLRPNEIETYITLFQNLGR